MLHSLAFLEVHTHLLIICTPLCRAQLALTHAAIFLVHRRKCRKRIHNDRNITEIDKMIGKSLDGQDA